MEKKKQLSNVAFGGNWSEEILVIDELRATLSVIDKAVDECMDRDVEDEELHQAMLYVRQNVEKGAMLCSAFFKALKIQDQVSRQVELQRVVQLIWAWSGLAR